MNDKQKYVISNEYEGAFVGTLDEISEWAGDRGVNVFDSEFYALGDEVSLKLSVV